MLRSRLLEIVFLISIFALKIRFYSFVNYKKMQWKMRGSIKKIHWPWPDLASVPYSKSVISTFFSLKKTYNFHIKFFLVSLFLRYSPGAIKMSHSVYTTTTISHATVIHAVAHSCQFPYNKFIANKVSKSNSKNSTLFVHMNYMSVDNFISIDCKVFISNIYCYDIDCSNIILD